MVTRQRNREKADRLKMVSQSSTLRCLHHHWCRFIRFAGIDSFRLMKTTSACLTDDHNKLLQRHHQVRTTMRVSLAAILLFTGASAFAPSQKSSVVNSQLFSSSKDLATAKAELLGLLGRQTSQIEGVADPVLADPETKEPIRVTSSGTIFGDGYGKTKQSLKIRSPTNEFEGSSSTYINLLEPKAEKKAEEDADILKLAARQLTPFIPPPLRAAVAASGLDVDGYVPMRDLFTSPAVSFAYERGWRQGFQQAGFPGPDREFEMAKEYFAPALADSSTLVDMSCATGVCVHGPKWKINNMPFASRSFSHNNRCFSCTHNTTHRSLHSSIRGRGQVRSRFGLRLFGQHAHRGASSDFRGFRPVRTEKHTA